MSTQPGRLLAGKEKSLSRSLAFLLFTFINILGFAMRHCPACKQEFKTQIVFCPTDGEKLVMAEKDDPLLGELIDGKYLVEAKVGSGATATVYRAAHVQLELRVA